MQGWTLLLIGPFLDRYVSSSWVFDFNYTFPALVFLVLSCSMAVFVNISQFMCLGRFSAVSFQVAFPLICAAAQQTVANADKVCARLNMTDMCICAECRAQKDIVVTSRLFALRRITSYTVHGNSVVCTIWLTCCCRCLATPKPFWCCLGAGCSLGITSPAANLLACALLLQAW